MERTADARQLRPLVKRRRRRCTAGYRRPRRRPGHQRRCPAGQLHRAPSADGTAGVRRNRGSRRDTRDSVCPTGVLLLRRNLSARCFRNLRAPQPDYDNYYHHRACGVATMRKLFQRQLAKATKEPGKVDLELLGTLVTAAYEEADRDRKRTDRSIALMADELQRTHARLLDAFKLVPEGLVLLDAEGKYVLFNDKFLELHDTAADTIAVGRSFADSIDAGVERGHYLGAIGREQEWLAERRQRGAQDRCSNEHHLRGDRWVRINQCRT